MRWIKMRKYFLFRKIMYKGGGNIVLWRRLSLWNYFLVSMLLLVNVMIVFFVLVFFLEKIVFL